MKANVLNSLSLESHPNIMPRQPRFIPLYSIYPKFPDSIELINPDIIVVNTRIKSSIILDNSML